MTASLPKKSSAYAVTCGTAGIEDLVDFKKVWGKSPLVVCNFFTAETVGEWLSLDEIASLLANPYFLHTNKAIMRCKDISRNHCVTNREEIAERLQKGLSLQLRHLERILPNTRPAVEFGLRLESCFGHPLDSATLFVTPPTEQALPQHTDATEVFCLQLAGQKCWNIDDITHILSPGDIAYIPAGTPHEVKATGTALSVSISYILKPITHGDLLRIWLDEKLAKAPFNESLPPLADINTGSADGSLEDTLDRTVAALIKTVGDAQSLAQFAKKESLKRRTPPAVDFGIAYSSDTAPRFIRNPAAGVIIEHQGPDIHLLVSGGTSLVTPYFTEPELTRVLEQHGPFNAEDIAVNLQVGECLTLLHKLHRVGLIHRVPADLKSSDYT